MQDVNTIKKEVKILKERQYTISQIIKLLYQEYNWVGKDIIKYETNQALRISQANKSQKKETIIKSRLLKIPAKSRITALSQKKANRVSTSAHKKPGQLDVPTVRKSMGKGKSTLNRKPLLAVNKDGNQMGRGKSRLSLSVSLPLQHLGKGKTRRVSGLHDQKAGPKRIRKATHKVDGKSRIFSRRSKNSYTTL